MPHSKSDYDNQISGHQARSEGFGLDPIATNRESGYMQGLFLRRLITLKLRTRNVFYLISMFLLGVVPFVVMFAMMAGAALGSSQNQRGFGFEAILGIMVALFMLSIPGMLALNFILSILEIAGIIPPLKTGRAKPAVTKKRIILGTNEITSHSNAVPLEAVKVKTSKSQKKFK
jgi:hypothetical protein